MNAELRAAPLQETSIDVSLDLDATADAGAKGPLSMKRLALR